MRNLLALLLLAPCALLAQVPDYVPADQLLAWYPFNGNANDESGNGLDGSVDGAALTEDRTGAASSAYVFDGTDRISTAGSPFNGQTTLTFSAWIQSDNLAPYSVLMSEWPAGGATFKLDHSVTDEFLRFDLITSDGFHSASVDFATSQWAEWSHFIAVYNGSAIQLYLDGEAIGAPVPASGSISATAGEMLIGDEANNSAPFQGRLDDIALWGRALTAAEIEAVYEATLGCTDPAACNYDEEATVDDGSCDYSCCPGPGCCADGTVWSAQLEQCVIDASSLIAPCGPGTIWDPLEGECVISIPTDTDFDGCISSGDLLNLLTTFGTCPEVDVCSECPEVPDNSGSTWSCGDPLPYQGYDYVTVQIGDQCWFAENLRNTAYSTGEPIETVANIEDWVASTEGLVETYGTNVWGCQDLEFAPFDVCNPDSSLQYFGRHYNWYAVDDARGLCPAGWHVPSDSAFATLEAFLGIPEDELFILGERGENQGSLLKSNPSDPYPWNGNNTTGFSAVPSGSIHNGLFTPTPSSSAGLSGSIWTSSAYLGGPPYAWYRGFRGNHDEISREAFYRYMGRSVRCLKD